LLEVAAQKRSRSLGVVGGLALLVVMLGGVSPLMAPLFSAKTGQPVRIGAKSFTEQYILADAIARRLDSEGFNAHRLSSLGSTVLFDALASGEIDCYVDYTGTIWANYMKRKDVPDAQSMLKKVSAWVQSTHGIRCVGPLGFENAYALAMRHDRAKALGIHTIADLARHADKLSIGSDYEFFDRPEWTRVKDKYHLHFRKRHTFDPSLMYPAVVNGQVDVITAYTTDGRIAAYHLTVLGDPRHAFPPYDAVLLLSPEAAKRPRLVKALSRLVNTVDEQTMRKANKEVDVDKKSIDEAASLLLDHMAKEPK